MIERVLTSRLKFLRQARQLEESRLEAADLRRLLWVLADQAGGTLTISPHALQQFDPRGVLYWRNMPDGSYTVAAKRRTQ